MTHDMPLVTIAIPTYNRAGYFLEQAIVSASNQTYPHIEIIIADNCSTDGTEQLVARLRGPNVKYIKHPRNIGAANNFNFCVDQAAGDYLLLYHDDDLIDPDLVESCIEAADYRTDLGLLRTGTRIIDAQGNIVRERPNKVVGDGYDDFIRGWFEGRTVLYLCSTLFNTRYLRNDGTCMSNHNVCLDVKAMLTLAYHYGRVDVAEVKASFRKHSGEITHSAKVSRWCEDSFEILDLIENTVTDRQYVKENGLRFFSRINYSRAVKVEHPLKRMLAYWTVYRYFKYKYPPSFNLITSVFHSALQNTFLMTFLQYIRRSARSLSTRQTP
jgi:glycosyltransferase involved in cell wall biosynthesis